MPRFTGRHTNKYFYDINESRDLDDLDDMNWRDGVSDRLAKVHCSDVVVEAYYAEDNFNYGITKHDYKIQKKIDKLNHEDSYVNLGTRPTRRKRSIREWSISRRLLKEFELDITE